MTTVTKYTTPGAAGAEVDRRAERHMAEHGCGYREAWHAILAADPELAQAYAMPAGAGAKKPTPAVPVTGGDEREIADWITRALKDNMVGSLPGALGSLIGEADTFVKTGLPFGEAVKRAMDLNPGLVTQATLELIDLRRNAPAPAGETAAAQSPGDTVHLRARALMDKDENLSYGAALHLVFDADPELKINYSRT